MFIGLDIGGTNIKGIISSVTGDILSSGSIKTGKTALDIDNAIVALIQDITSTRSISLTKIKAVGIGAAGAIDNKNGIIITSPNIPSWKNYPLVKNINKRTGLKAFLENDATVAVIGEWWQGAGKPFSDWIMLTLGTGIGGGAVINNKLHTGKSGSSMEFGHLSIDYKGEKCGCGSTGCLEAYASATALVKFTKRNLRKYPQSSVAQRSKNELITAKMIGEEASRGDELALAMFGQIAFYLGVGVANLVNIFSPEAVIIGGGLSHSHRLILPVMKQTINKRALPGLKNNIKYIIAKKENITPALGAAKVAIDAILKP